MGLKIAICGIRGVPANYGGFETFAEELATRLVAAGHAVRVYGRKHFISHPETHYKGIELCVLPAPRHKYLETPLHTLFSFLHLLRNRVDVVLLCNAANSPFAWLLRLARIPVAINVDGIERKRAKWNMLGRCWYWLGEVCSVMFASRIVADAKVIQDYYEETYHARAVVIPYGYRADADQTVSAKLLGEAGGSDTAPIFQELRVKPGRYLLYVSRLEPENNAHRVIAAYEALGREGQRMPLVIVGDAPYAADYVRGLREAAGENVRFAGFRFGSDYRELQLGAYLYIQATEVGGTHPALVEAMGYGNCVLANETPENVEVLGEAGYYYRKNDEADIRRSLAMLLDAESDARIKEARQKAVLRARALYDWARVTASYQSLFSEIAN